MIDAPDHAAQERGNRSAGAWLLVALLGIALSVVAGMMSYGYTTAQAEQRFADVVDYVATQSLSYDAFNSAYTTKNLIRVMEIAGEAARDMERDRSVDNATLEQYADQFNVSALIVTDASGSLVSECSTDDVGYESLATYLKEAPVLEVAAHPLKSYTARITLADDSVADIGCVTRQDGEGIVAAVRHQSAKAVASNTLKLQSLLGGYETIDSGNIVIESDGKVVATNAVEPTILGVFDLPATDVFIVDGIKDRCPAGKVRLVNANGEWYLGTFGKARGFYVYTYASARRYFEVVAAVAAGVLVLYSGVIAVVVMARRRADRRRLTDLLQQERDYGDKLAKAAREASSANSAKTEFLRLGKDGVFAPHEPRSAHAHQRHSRHGRGRRCQCGRSAKADRVPLEDLDGIGTAARPCQRGAGYESPGERAGRPGACSHKLGDPQPRGARYS